MRHRFNPSGLIVAVLGFLLTRFTVTFAVTNTLITFAVGGILPLVMGLSLSAFGVLLTVGVLERPYVRTIVFWTILGLAVVGVLVVTTIYGSHLEFDDHRTVTALFANILIGGSVGGALTGVYAGQNRRYQRELLNRKNRLVVLNRLLHDEVMNAVTVIKGVVPLLQEDEEEGIGSVDAILEKTASIEEVMSSVRDLAEPGREAEIQPMSVRDAVETAVERARQRHDDGQFVATSLPDDVTVCANRRLVDVLSQLLVNGAQHANTRNPRVEVRTEVRDDTVQFSVVDEGPGLPESGREALERGTTIVKGDPTLGLGLYLVRLFVRTFQGSIETSVEDSGTTVFITLRRGDGPGRPGWVGTVQPSDPVAQRRLGKTVLISLAAGAIMGVYVHLTAGAVPVIGALYGIENAFVGGLTHEFHSVVFGLIYAGLLSVLPDSHARTWSGHIGLGTSWGIALWFVAGGFIMPIWLNLVGIPEPVPALQGHSLVAHILWGVSLGGLDYASEYWSPSSGSP